MPRSLLRRHADEGVTLVEMLVALFILAIVFLGMASTMITSLRAGLTSEQQQVGTAVAMGMIEEANTLPWDVAAVYEGDISGADPDATRWRSRLDANGDLDGNPLVTIAGPDTEDDRDPDVPRPWRVEDRNAQSYTMDFYPVWVDLSGDGNVDAKQFVVFTTFEGRSGDTELRTVGDRAPVQGEAGTDFAGTRLLQATVTPSPVQLDATTGRPTSDLVVEARFNAGMTDAEVTFEHAGAGGAARTKIDTMSTVEASSEGGWTRWQYTIAADEYALFNGQTEFVIVGQRSGGGIDVEGSAVLQAHGGPYDERNTDSASVELVWSHDRNEDDGDLMGGQPLDGSNVSGWVYVWADIVGASPDTVDFYIDGEHYRTESLTPYELAGTPAAFNTRGLDDGPHTLRVVGNYDGDDFEATARFTVSNDTPPITIYYASTNDRSAARPLNNPTVSGDLYLWAETEGANPASVTWYWDDAEVRLDQADPFTHVVDTTNIGNGSHVIRAEAHLGADTSVAEGGVIVANSGVAPVTFAGVPQVSTFCVNNGQWTLNNAVTIKVEVNEMDDSNGNVSVTYPYWTNRNQNNPGAPDKVGSAEATYDGIFWTATIPAGTGKFAVGEDITLTITAVRDDDSNAQTDTTAQRIYKC